MNKKFTYDGKDEAQRKEIFKYINIKYITVFIIIELILILFCLGIYFLIFFTNAGEPLAALSLFLSFNIPTIIVFLLLFLFVKLVFKSTKLEMILTDDKAIYDENGSFISLNVAVEYLDIKKVYIGTFAKTPISQKNAPFCEVMCKVKKITRNGEAVNLVRRKNQTRVLFYAKSLQEAEEIVAFIKSKMSN